MKRCPAKLVAAAVALIAGLVPLAAASDRQVHPPAAETYTITSTLELAPPFNLADMTDDFQEARLVSRRGEAATFEITYFPLYRPAMGENANWRRDYAGMTEYLRPTPTENWDDAMRRDLIAALAADGILVEQLTDRALVEKVSRWAMKRTESTRAFAIWTIHFPDGKPAIFPPLRAAFEHERSDPTWTDQQMIGREVLGRSMFYEKVHGACTSSSIYLSTIFRALGIPTRIVLCVPPFDPNDAAQARMFYDAIHHHEVRETVRTALESAHGFVDHFFNEVYVGNRWERLNYSRLGQPILDAHYFGLLTHILTTADMSQVPFAETWGVRFFINRDAAPKLSSVNPYRLLAVKDQFGEKADVSNPPAAPPPELTRATITALLRADSHALPRFVVEGLKKSPRRPDFFLSYSEWLSGTHTQMNAFERKVGHEFELLAPGQPAIHARLHGLKVSQGDGSFQAFAVEIAAADRNKVAPGVAYALKPINTSEQYRWVLAPDLSPIVLKD